MSTSNKNKLKKLIDLHVPGTVILAAWLESVGVGAFKRPNEKINWQGGLYSLQNQIQLPIHIGGLTALSLMGFFHYIRTGAETVYLFPLQKQFYLHGLKNMYGMFR